MNCNLLKFFSIAQLAIYFGVILSVFAANKAFAIYKTDDIDTNRPSFMFSPLVLPKGSLQLENGALYSGLRQGRWALDLPETQVRVGLIPSTEFQVSVPNYVLSQPGNNRISGVTDISELGLKYQLPLNKFSDKMKMAVISSVSVPTGASRLSLGGTTGAIRLPYTYALNKNWSVGGMQSLLLIDHGNSLQWQPDVLVSRAIGSRASCFLEYGGYFTEHNYPVNLIHLGAVYKITRHQQIDTQCGFGTNRAAASAFVGLGYSFRVDGLF